MVQRTFCPACGAPLEVREGQDRVECNFCNTQFTIQPGEEQPALSVESQPGPQKDVLAEKGSRVLEESIQASPAAPQSGGEPVAPGFASLEIDHADPQAVGLPAGDSPSASEIYDRLGGPDTGSAPPPSLFDVGDPSPAPPAVPTMAASYPVDTGPSGSRRSGPLGRGQWIAIAVAVFVVTCILCACLAGAALLVNSQTVSFFPAPF